MRMVWGNSRSVMLPVYCSIPGQIPGTQNMGQAWHSSSLLSAIFLWNKVSNMPELEN